MKIGKLVGDLVESGDPGAYIKQELEEGLEPITKRIERLEKKVDMLILLLKSIDENLKKLQPLYDLIIKLPFFKK
jgi:chaperonin cofactor prefoldin